MALKQAGSIGYNGNIIKLSILKDNYAQQLFNSTETDPIMVRDIYLGHHKEYYNVIGDDVGDLMIPMSSISKELNFIRLEKGFIKLIESRTFEETLSTGAYVSMRSFTTVYKPDGSSTPTELYKYAPYCYLKYIDPAGMVYDLPVLMSLLYDDELKKARLIINKYFDPTNANVPHFDHNFSNLNYHYGDTAMYNLIFSSIQEYDNDPWANSGYADIGGGNGELDLSSDAINLPELPTSAVSSGFIQLYTPSLKQLNELSDYMWGDGFLDNVLKLWNDPMDIILNLAQFPFLIQSAGSQYVTAGNVITNVLMNYPPNQYVTIDCGSIFIKNFYNAYVDYEPYASCEIYLPYIGYQHLSMNDIMGKTVRVVYRIDLLTGVSCAYILCDDIVMYSFAGTCSANIPVSGQSFQSMAQSLINIATSGVAGKLAEHGNPGGNMLTSTMSSMMSFKPNVARSGNVSANTGMLGPQKPYLIYHIPRTCLPKNQNTFLGYPAFITYQLSELKGFTVVEEIFLNECSCTEEEKLEIINLLKEGVIL